MSNTLGAEDLESIKTEPEGLWNHACLEWPNLFPAFSKSPCRTRFQGELPGGLKFQSSADQRYVMSLG